MDNQKKERKTKSQKRVIPLRASGEPVSSNNDRPSKSLFDEVKKQLENESKNSLFVFSEENNELENLNIIIPTSTTSTTSISPSSTSSTSTSSTSKNEVFSKELNDVFQFEEKLIQPISPIRDFQKVPNSITREFLPQGLFRGKSKQIYDFLWSISRGSIHPVRKVKVSRAEIKKRSGIGSLVTVDLALEHLQEVGLIVKVISAVGSVGGNEYEILTPEEINLTSTSSTSTSTTSIADSSTSIARISQKVDELVDPETGSTRTTQSVENNTSYSAAKTFINTIREKNFDDDRYRETFSDFFIVIEETIKKYQEKGINPNDRAKWKHVAEVLAAQIDLIASRTTISNFPAVLAEHLQRHLNNKRVLEKMGLITPAEARKMKDQPVSKQEIQYLFLCPDCKGTSMWNRDGKGMRPGCPHERLEDAIEKARENGDI